MLAWLQLNRAVMGRKELAMLCGGCPCKLEFEVCASVHCGCFMGGHYLGKLKGRYKVTYRKGAVMTQSGWSWNQALQGHCYGDCEQPCFGVFLGGNLCPGFNATGFPTAQEAEDFWKGSFDFMDFDGIRDIYLRYSDDTCSDSLGCITYSLLKVSDLTEAQRQIESLPKELQ